MRPLPSLHEMAGFLAERHPLPEGFLPLVNLDPSDPDAPTALRAILSTTKQARLRLRQVNRTLGNPEGIGVDTGAGLQHYGYRRVHSAGLIAILVSGLDHGTNVLDSVQFWRRQICVAFGTALLIPDDAPENPYSAATGLLHEIGFLLLDIERSDLTALLPTVGRRRGGLDADAERAVLGYALHELTAVILGRWGLPAPIVTAVLERERGPLERGRLGAALWIAVEGANTLGFGGAFYPQRRDLDPRLARAIERFYGSTGEVARRVDGVLAGVLLDDGPVGPGSAA
ncbi:MAG: hypothetical protein AMXMBFR23_26620 [Chloroflexota bacterium]